VSLYEFQYDGGSWVPNGLATSKGGIVVHAGPHTWAVRARDNAGNILTYNFSFTATPGNDIQIPSAFNLLTPMNNASITPGTTFTWQPATDFNGIARYDIYVDGGLKGTVSGTTTSFTPDVGTGTVRCGTNYDATINTAGCAYNWSYPAPFTIGTHTGSISGNSLGFDSYELDRQTRQATMTVDVPVAGADLRFWNSYDNHATFANDGSVLSAWEGGTIQISLDGGATWKTTCTTNAKQKYGTTVKCNYPIVEQASGYTGVLAAGGGNPLQYQEVFAGNSNGFVQSRVRLSLFAGRTIQVRFVHGWDACTTTTAPSLGALCPPGVKPSKWLIDDVQITDPALASGPHSWYVTAIDGSANANARQSTQTWNFIWP
jgi:hypothetical protein